MSSNNPLTDQELLESQQLQAYHLDARSENFAERLLEFEETIPAWVHMSDLKDIKVTHANQVLSEFFDKSKEEIAAWSLGELYGPYVDMNTYHSIMPYLIKFVTNDDESDILSFFQRVRPAPEAEFEWFYSTTKLIRSKNSLITITTPIKQMQYIGRKMNRFLDENMFVKRHFRKFAALTKREKEILTLVAGGMSNPQIADQLFISRRTVEQHRKNINKKLDSNNLAYLIKFAQAFELI